MAPAAEGVAGHRLGARDRDLVRPGAEYGPEGAGLGSIALRGGRGVGVDGRDRVGGHVGVGQGEADGARPGLSGRVGPDRVERLVHDRAAGEHRQDLRPPRPRPVEPLEHEHPGPLREDEAAASPREGRARPDRVLRDVHARVLEARVAHEPAHAGFAAADEHRVRPAHAHLVRTQQDGGGAGRAGVRDAEARPAELVAQREQARHRGAGDGDRGHPRDLVGVLLGVGGVEGAVPELGPGEPGADDAAEAVGIDVPGEAGLGEGLAGGGEREEHARLLAGGGLGLHVGAEADDGAADAVAEVRHEIGRAHV